MPGCNIISDEKWAMSVTIRTELEDLQKRCGENGHVRMMTTRTGFLRSFFTNVVERRECVDCGLVTIIHRR